MVYPLGCAWHKFVTLLVTKVFLFFMKEKKENVPIAPLSGSLKFTYSMSASPLGLCPYLLVRTNRAGAKAAKVLIKN